MFQRWKNLINFAKASRRKQELSGAVIPIATFIAGTALVNGLANRQPVCVRCFSIFTPREHDFAERFTVRSILSIPDKEPDPMLCEHCYGSIQQEFNRQGANIGTSNSGPRNLALHELH
jgi:hypothetical protein